VRCRYFRLARRKMHKKFSWRAVTRNLRRDVTTLWFALKHPQTPWLARVLAFVLTAYAFSPVDLIPDFIPVLGHLDDLIIIPLGVWLLLRMLPPSVVAHSRTQADAWLELRRGKPTSQLGLVIVVSLWALAAWLSYSWYVS
jgi:uncharacterized membrane protein YkvA (DUF1232 family)